MLNFLKLLVTFCLVSVLSANRYDGYKIYEVTPHTRAASEQLKNFGKNEELYDFLNYHYAPGSTAHVMVHPAELEHFDDFLKTEAFDFKVINQDFGLTLKRETETNRMLRNSFPYNGRLGTERYYTHDEINQYIEDLSKQYPTRVFLKTVGKTYEGRHLKAITVTNGDRRTNKNVIFMDGGFHAREWLSPAAVIYAIEQLVEKFNENSDLLLDYDWVILPVVNADGYEYTQLTDTTRNWRKTRKPSSDTCIGTDPNRNFDFHWREAGASSNPCSDTYAGETAFSESEAVVVRDLIHTLSGRGKMYLTVHTYGEYILYPWGWTSDLPDTVDDLHEVAMAGYNAILEATGTNYTVGSSTNVLYIAAGASDDYAFYSGFPISFTMELPGGGYGFAPPASLIDGYVKETWVGIRAMAKKVIEKYPLN